MNWCDAAPFTNALSTREGRTAVYQVGEDCESGGAVGVVAGANGYRLPTEAEWEYAARAGSTTRYWSGQEEADLARVGWYDNNADETHPVGQKPANPWGLYDVHVNVLEWCHDPYTSSYNGVRAGEIQDPLRPAATGADRVIRGGSFVSSPQRARSAYHNRSIPGFDWHNRGFRVVLPQGTARRTRAPCPATREAQAKPGFLQEEGGGCGGRPPSLVTDERGFNDDPRLR